ncbi:uncharacterized protein BDZ99DRAFT_461709 [Mytilinidion resinicola]|uniref:Uncharacterized protein n=1 Tax=Mytilinidion resinicola TaxID=574789 RepID=A0A6A6YTL1_9PEZI|nr:uncharacterized protein BDZ99DRAFT_461709 [Mytilinidion resinicola]KAF2811713.1 hypothetical protein BDZ99DRAFT_461709 [Mytilinidion resinicola]
MKFSFAHPALPFLAWLLFVTTISTTTVEYYSHDTHLSLRSPPFGSSSFQPVYYDPPVLELEQPTEPPPQNATVQRCHAQELSQGNALWMLLILGVGCVVHMPGSLTWLGHKGLYRLVPEFGIMEAVALFILVLKGIFYHHQSIRRSIRASLALRNALGEGESWWLVDAPSNAAPITTESFNVALNDQEMHLARLNMTPQEALEHLDPFLTSLRDFNVSRLLGSILTTLTLVKASAATGTIRTTVLACSYYLSFFIIDALAWLCLSPGPPPSKGEREREAYAVARLMAALDPFREALQQKSTSISNPGPWRRLDNQAYEEYIAAYGTTFSIQGWPEPWTSWPRIARTVFVTTALVAAAIAVLISTFWPVSVPIFLVFNFSAIQKGKWTFIYLNSLIWLFWVGVASALFLCSTFLVSKVRSKTFSEVVAEMNEKFVPRSWAGLNFALAGYGMLKVALIVRLYFHDYSGANTMKPGWVDWLG